MKKTLFVLLAIFIMPQIVLSQTGFHQPDISVYDNIPLGYRVFPLPVDIYKLKGLQAKHRIDVFATFNKKEKISALLAEMKSAKKNEMLGTIPMVFKTDADEEFITILLLQNIQVLYIPSISSDYALDYPEIGVEAKVEVNYNNYSVVTPKLEAKEKQTLLAKTAIIRLLLTPEDAQLAAHAVATDMKLSLVIRDSADMGVKILQPVDTSTFKKERK
jgi:hypothetical protein